MAASIEHHHLPLPRIDGSLRLLVVVAPYYRDIANDLVAGAGAIAVASILDLAWVRAPFGHASRIGIGRFPKDLFPLLLGDGRGVFELQASSLLF